MQKQTEAEIDLAAAAYFAACNATREKITLKTGEHRYYQVPYTLAGLCAALGVTRTEFSALMRGKNAGVRRACRAAMMRVEQHTLERALLGEIDRAVADMLLKSWGYGSEEQGAAAQELRVTLEDPEQLAR
ncbi:DNA-packaging protein [Christensenellaceae bacterium OttesenSCG-928-L17]|nr:DNA-packaging protein [Christensenellaceae bacterium OttesenSCG-928-L17]